MELTEAIYHRRAVRSYTDQMVPKSDIGELIDAAIQAPSAVNQQPWAFAVVRGRSRLESYSEKAKAYMLSVLPQSLALHRRSDELTQDSYNVFHHAGTLIVIYARQAPHHPAEDCCLAAQNLMLAAHGMGLATCPIGFVRPWLDLPDVKSLFGIPSSFTPVMPLVVGYPAKPAPAKPVRQEPEILAWVEADAP